MSAPLVIANARIVDPATNTDRKGAVLVADGRIEGGTTQVDEALLTGESTPLLRGPGDDAGVRDRGPIQPLVRGGEDRQRHRPEPGAPHDQRRDQQPRTGPGAHQRTGQDQGRGPVIDRTGAPL